LLPAQVDKDEVNSIRKLIQTFSGIPDENLNDRAFTLTRYFQKAKIIEDVRKVDSARLAFTSLINWQEET
jgi:hypothetical protein